MKKTVKIILFVLLVFLISVTVFYFWGSSGTIPENELSRIKNYCKDVKDPPGNRQVFRVITYNIGYLSGMTNNLPVRTEKEFFQENMENFLTLLKEINPDFIGFQEIDINSHRSYNVNQPDVIAEKTGFSHSALAINWDKRYVPFPYWPPSVHFKRMLSGQVILSRYPIIKTNRIVLKKPDNKPFYYNAFYLDRLIQVAEIRIKGRILLIMNVHLEAFERETRELQARVVMSVYREFKDKYPVILIGDFNCVPPHAKKKSGFTDDPGQDFTKESTIKIFLEEKSLNEAILDSQIKIDEKGKYTFPSNNPTRKLDYIFYTHGSIELLRGEVLKSDSSDHLPVLMEFRFRD